MKTSHSRHADKIFDLSEKEGNLKAYIQELEEAIVAGVRVKRDLLEAKNSLKKANDWGTFDMFGGGTISSFVKHQHIDEAEASIHRAQTSMRYFQKELLDVQEEAHLEVDISGMLKFADFFLDGFFVDMMVQSKISESLEQTKNQFSKVNEVLSNLTDQFEARKRELEFIQKEKQEMIEGLEKQQSYLWVRLLFFYVAEKFYRNGGHRFHSGMKDKRERGRIGKVLHIGYEGPIHNKTTITHKRNILMLLLFLTFFLMIFFNTTIFVVTFCPRKGVLNFSILHKISSSYDIPFCFRTFVLSVFKIFKDDLCKFHVKHFIYTHCFLQRISPF